MLIDPNKSFTENSTSFALNGVEGMALNKAVKITMPGTKLSNVITEKLGAGLGGEIATHMIGGASFSAVRAGFDKQTWTDANGNLALGNGAAKFAEATALGALINIPAGMAGARVAGSLSTNLAEGSLTRIIAGTTAGATSGGVFNFTDSYIKNKDFGEAGQQFLIGAAVGAAMGVTGTGIHEFRNVDTKIPTRSPDGRTLRSPDDETVGGSPQMPEFEWDEVSGMPVPKLQPSDFAPSTRKEVEPISPDAARLQDVLSDTREYRQKELIRNYWDALTSEQKQWSQGRIQSVVQTIDKLATSSAQAPYELTLNNLTPEQRIKYALQGLESGGRRIIKIESLADEIPGLRAAVLNSDKAQQVLANEFARIVERSPADVAHSASKTEWLRPDSVEQGLAIAASNGSLQRVMRFGMKRGDDLTAAVKLWANVEDLSEPNAKLVVERLINRDSDLRRDYETQFNLKDAAERFGAKRILEYYFDPKRTSHDVFFNFGKILRMQEKSGVSPDEFFNNILRQVKRDNSVTDEGSAHARLNAIASNPLKTVDEVKNAAAKNPDVKLLQALVADFPDQKSIFASWKSLEKYARLQAVVERQDIFDKIQKLRADGKTDLANWTETLILNPKSRVSLQSVQSFVDNPELFLDRDDLQSHARVHWAKKPSNYTDIPNLDLTAVQLRDALVNGTIDRLQAYSPMTAEYEVGSKPISSELKLALGSNGSGKAQRVGRLFKEVKDLLAPENLTPQDVIAGAKVPPHLEPLLEKLIYDKTIGLPEQPVKYKFSATIHRKSDPLAAIAGDETECCMGFGTGKNNIYMINPNDSIFTIRAHREDGSSTIIAQSVLTKDVNVDTNVPALLGAIESGNEDVVHTLVSDEVLRQQKSFIAGDNIEVRENAKEKRAVIEAIYKDFFARYVQAHGKEENLNEDKMIIGLGHGDALTQLEREPNTFVPQAPPGYSDKDGPEVGVLPLEHSTTAGLRLVNLEHQPITDRLVGSNAPGVTPLTFESTLQVGYIESKAFENAPSFRAGLHNMENALIAKDINNQAKGRPNLSLKYIDETGKMNGYLLAYEGVADIQGKPTPSIFISDFSTLKRPDGSTTFTSQIGGGRMLLEFGDLYKRHYLDKGRALPIVANAKEDTSFRLISRNLQKLGKHAGVPFVMQKDAARTQDNSIVHDVVLMPQVAAAGL